MVGGNNAIGAKPDDFLAVFLIDDPLNYKFALPAIPYGADSFLVEASGEGLVHEEAEMFHAQAFRDVGGQGLELGGACCELREGPGGM